MDLLWGGKVARLQEAKASRSAGTCAVRLRRRKRKTRETDEASMDESVVPERRGNGLGTGGEHGDGEGVEVRRDKI